MLEQISDVMLVVATVATLALLLIYGLLQPWWRSWVGITMIIVLTALLQVFVRAIITLRLGEDYAGRDWVLLAGRTQIALGMTIGSFGLGRELWKAWRGMTLPEMPPWDTRTGHHGSRSPSADSDPT